MKSILIVLWIIISMSTSAQTVTQYDNSVREQASIAVKQYLCGFKWKSSSINSIVQFNSDYTYTLKVYGLVMSGNWLNSPTELFILIDNTITCYTIKTITSQQLELVGDYGLVCLKPTK
jgi:hypothetical protein